MILSSLHGRDGDELLSIINQNRGHYKAVQTLVDDVTKTLASFEYIEEDEEEETE